MEDRVEAEPTDGRVASTNRPVPLNSKRLTGILLRQLARGLEIEGTTGTSVSELRQLVEGKIGDLGHEPRHTQVLLAEVENGVQICLRDAEGIFLTVDPLLEMTEPRRDTVPEEIDARDDPTEVAELKEALLAAEEARAALEVELNQLKQQLVQERDKYKQLWGLNCLQVAEFDQTLAEKEELESLRQKLPRTRVNNQISD
uniref:Uncharacterized protein n=1 Tax=Amphimedon queenslandica TaxID=400682 RepID=A0A1X7SN98_AMPQE